MTTNNEQNGKKQSAIFPRACVLALTALVAVGCAAEGDDDITSEALASDVPCGEEPKVDGGTEPPVPDPQGAYFASITANGTGCPAGTWDTQISEDGATFTSAFKAYEAVVNETSSVAIKNCQLTVKLHSPKGLSYRVKNFGFTGHAKLDEGVQARLIAQYYFQGNPVASEQVREELVGPLDDAFTFEDRVATTDGVWSPCGLERNLNINTTVRVQNTTPKKTGSVKVDNVLGLELEWRVCDAGPTEPKPAKPTEPEEVEPEDAGPEAAEPEDAAVKPDAGAAASAAPTPRRPRGWWARGR